jgi:phosphotransferase system enzyme I (PtsI)
MERYQGKSIYNSIAFGRLHYFAKAENVVKRRRIEDAEAEIVRYEAAKGKAIEELQVLYEKAVKEVGEVNAQIFEVHQMMLEDEDYNNAIYHLVRTQMVNAEYAVASTGDSFAQLFSDMEDEYMKARSIDIKDISERVAGILSGHTAKENIGEEPVILLAQDLAPSETVQLDKSRLLAFVTRQGSSNSHTAILARTMQLPALIGIEVRPEWHGRMAVVDGFRGELILDPGEELLAEYRCRMAEQKEKRELLKQLKGKENVTGSGRKINLYANIGSLQDLASVLENDAGGIGLFRSEFLYLEADDYPTEEEQFRVYMQAARTMADKQVIIRTLDIGADKQAPYFELEPEDNPALGYRAIRICLTRQEVFKTQLRALFRASAYGNVAVMYPMITSLEEVRRIKDISKAVKEELRREGIPIGDRIEEGIMIETPAAALISDLLAQEVDFFSIGTNDLTQYTLAIDRMNPLLDEFYQPHHEAVLRQIKMVAENAHKAGIWCGICGELAADRTLTKTFLEYGIDELSVSAGDMLAIRKIIRELD